MVGSFIKDPYLKPHELMAECLNADLPWGDDLFLPIPGGHIKLAERFVDPALGKCKHGYPF